MRGPLKAYRRHTTRSFGWPQKGLDLTSNSAVTVEMCNVSGHVRTAGSRSERVRLIAAAHHRGMPITLRAAFNRDFDYCRRVYFQEMESIIEELHLDRTAQVAGFHKQWDVSQVRIITLDGADIGWLQTFT